MKNDCQLTLKYNSAALVKSKTFIYHSRALSLSGATSWARRRQERKLTIYTRVHEKKPPPALQIRGEKYNAKSSLLYTNGFNMPRVYLSMSWVLIPVVEYAYTQFIDFSVAALKRLRDEKNQCHFCAQLIETLRGGGWIILLFIIHSSIISSGIVEGVINGGVYR